MSTVGLTQRRAAPWSPGTAVTRIVPRLALLGLGACVGLSWWIAAAAAHGRYLLELPVGGAAPSWVAGPLRGLAPPIGPGSFSAAVIAMSLAYAAALAGARTISVRFAVVAIALANLAFTLGPTIVSTDVFGYISYARLAVVHGINPYLHPPIAAPHDPVLPLVYWKHATSPYGPLFTAGSAPLALLSPAAALWTF